MRRGASPHCLLPDSMAASNEKTRRSKPPPVMLTVNGQTYSGTGEIRGSGYGELSAERPDHSARTEGKAGHLPESAMVLFEVEVYKN